VTKTGRYYVFLRAKRGNGTEALDDENDCLVEIDGQKLYGGDGSTRVDGMRSQPLFWAWSFLPKGPGNHTPENIKYANVHAVIGKAGTHQFSLKHRSDNFSIDKILLKHESVPDAKAMPPDYGPPETE
jgi:hypothetical protein